MSRFRNTARSLSAGCLAMACNALYTLASVPLALHYLSKEQIGLWALATQVAGYLLWIDMGITGAVSRILIDHKDHREAGGYGSVIKTASVVLTLQGICIAVVGCIVAYWLPSIMGVPSQYATPCRYLVGIQCATLGLFFSGRVLSGLLQAHQRFDLLNYSSVGQFIVGLGTQWLAFNAGMGIYSLLIAGALQYIFGVIANLLWVKKLKFFPSGQEWGQTSSAVFKEVFAFGAELFLLSIGGQLLNATQVVILTRTVGLSAAGIWTIATKAYPFAFQLVSRLYDYSSSALGEMFVRRERVGLERRFRDIFVLTALAAAFVGTGLAACNSNFLAVWTGRAISWPMRNDLLLGLFLFVTCVNRVHVCLVGTVRQIGAMRYIYFAEGITFVVAAFLTAPRWGITAILSCAIAADCLWSGIYGMWRTAAYFEVSPNHIVFGWLGSTWRYLAGITPVAIVVYWATLHLPILPRLLANVSLIGAAGLVLLWFTGLPRAFREELKRRISHVIPGSTKRPTTNLETR